MKKTFFILLVLIILALNIQAKKHHSKTGNETKKEKKKKHKTLPEDGGMPLFGQTLTQKDYKELYEKITHWDRLKPISISTVKRKDIPVYNNGQLSADFEGKNENTEDSKFLYNHSVAHFKYSVNIHEDNLEEGSKIEVVSLNNFMLEFESLDESAVKVYWQEHVPKSFKDFSPNDELVNQQAHHIRESGIFETQNDQEKEKLIITEEQSNRQAFVLMICEKDSGIHKIKGKAYPHVYHDEPDKQVEFYFYKDCNHQNINNQLEIVVNHYCHHHGINEEIQIFKDGAYHKEYMQGDHKEAVYIEKVNPQVFVRVSGGNQFVANPRFEQIGGPKNTQNMVKVKRNIQGGFIENGQMEFQITSTCHEKVGEQLWKFSLEFPPFDDLHINFKTECDEAVQPKDFTEFPLIIGANNKKDNVAVWGKPNPHYDINSTRKIKTLYHNDKSIKFDYDFTPSEKDQKGIAIEIHNPTITPSDHEIVEVQHLMSPHTVIDGTEEVYLELRLKCLKRGEARIEVFQEFDYPKISKQEIEFGFIKKCDGYDYSADLQDFDDEESSSVLFIVIIIVVCVIAFHLIKTGIREEAQKKNQLPTRSSQQQWQGVNQEEQAFKRQTFNN